jgi:rfaE bifunctional protein nucleotidyltransferase chain/domain
MNAHGTARDKVMSRTRLAALIGSLQGQGRRVVFTNGCFDLLHPGHVRYLERARALGDILVIAVNSDDSVRRLKGPGRPIIPESDRSEVVAALQCVDYVTIFTEDTPLEVIEQLRPDVLVKGGDWPKDQIVGRRSVEQRGGQVVTIEFEQGFSTTGIIERIRGTERGV